MSKSSPSIHSRILLTDSPTAIAAKFKSAVTDSRRDLAYDPVMRPGVSNMLDILAACTGETIEEIVARMVGKGHSDLKSETADAVTAALAGPRAEFEVLRSDETELKRVMKKGRKRARGLAARTLAEVKKLIGMI